MKIEVDPGEEQPYINWKQDPQGNFLANEQSNGGRGQVTPI